MNDQLERVRDDYYKSLAGTFEARSKGFQGLSLALLTFALAFFFFILLPNVLIQTKTSAIESRLIALKSQHEQSQKMASAYQRALAGLSKLQTSLKNGPLELRQFITSGMKPSSPARELPLQPNLPSSPGFPPSPGLPLAPGFPPLPALPDNIPNAAQNEPVPFTPLPAPSDVGSLNVSQFAPPSSDDRPLADRVREKLQSMMANYRTIAEQEIVKPLQEVGDHSLADPLRTLSAAIPSSFDSHLKERPQFWTTVQGKNEFFIEINDDFQKTWDELAQAAQIQPDKLQELQARQSSLQADIQQMEVVNQTLVAKRAEFSDRLAKIQSPLGNLPVGLSEAILIFPILLSIGFLVLAYQFRDMLRLRQELYQLTLEKDPQQQVITDHRFGLTAPIWFDWTLSQKHRGFGRFVTLLPLTVVLLAVVLIIYSWTISAELLSVPYSEWIYSAVYAVCVAGLFVQWRKLSRELAELTRHQPLMSSHPQAIVR